MDDAAIRYNFVSDDYLQSSVRLVSQDNAGTINGSYTEQTSSNADKVIVYAYKKGTFSASTEAQAQGDDAIFFKNAVASTEVRVGLAGTRTNLLFWKRGIMNSILQGIKRMLERIDSYSKPCLSRKLQQADRLVSS